MRLALIATLAIGLAASLSVPTPASADDNQLWTDCKQTGDNAKKIAACAKLVDAEFEPVVRLAALLY